MLTTRSIIIYGPSLSHSPHSPHNAFHRCVVVVAWKWKYVVEYIIRQNVNQVRVGRLCVIIQVERNIVVLRHSSVSIIDTHDRQHDFRKSCTFMYKEQAHTHLHIHIRMYAASAQRMRCFSVSALLLRCARQLGWYLERRVWSVVCAKRIRRLYRM